MRTIAFILSLIFIFLIPWEGVMRLPGLGNGSKLFGYVVAGCWIVAVVAAGRLRKFTPYHIAACAFVLWNAMTTFWSADPVRTVGHVATWIQLLGVVVILWDLYTTRTAVLAGLQAYVLGAFVAIANAVANFLSGEQFYTHYDRYSPDDTNPDGFAFIIVLGIPLAWYLAASQNSSKMGSLLKWFNFLYIPAALLGIALSGTRTALVASIPAMVFGLASLTSVRLSTRIAIVLLFAAAVLIFVPRLQTARSFQRLGTTATELTEGDLNNRTNNWREGLASFAEHPLLGVGSKMYRSVNTWGKVAHNTFLSVLVESGLIGLILFGIVLTIASIQAWNQPKWDSRFWVTVLMVWAIGASTLTWEHRKSTWLILSLIVASAALTGHRDRAVSSVRRNHSEIQPNSPTERSKWLKDAKGKPHLG